MLRPGIQFHASGKLEAEMTVGSQFALHVETQHFWLKSLWVAVDAVFRV